MQLQTIFLGAIQVRGCKKKLANGSPRHTPLVDTSIAPYKVTRTNSTWPDKQLTCCSSIDFDPILDTKKCKQLDTKNGCRYSGFLLGHDFNSHALSAHDKVINIPKKKLDKAKCNSFQKNWHVLVQHLALCMFSPPKKKVFLGGSNFPLHIFGGFWGSFMHTLFPYDLPFLPIGLFLGVCVCVFVSAALFALLLVR